MVNACTPLDDPLHVIRYHNLTFLYSMADRISQHIHSLLHNTILHCITILILVCFYIELCPELSSPLNGIVTYKSTQYLSRARYSCQDGYRLVGKDSLRCKTDGQWSSDPPNCEGSCIQFVL